MLHHQASWLDSLDSDEEEQLDHVIQPDQTYWIGQGFRPGASTFVQQALEALNLSPLQTAGAGAGAVQTIASEAAASGLPLRKQPLPRSPTLLWLTHCSPFEVQSLNQWQHVNSMPGYRSLTLKHNLLTAIHTCKQRLHQHDSTNTPMAQSELFGFWPQSFMLSDECQQQQALALVREQQCCVIVKNSEQACGRGVFLAPTSDRLQWLMASEQSPCWPIKRSRAIAQRYIASPLLLDGFKFTLRIYALISCADPLTVYVYSRGLVRMCSKRYGMPDLPSRLIDGACSV
jgi:hypothetical protein